MRRPVLLVLLGLGAQSFGSTAAATPARLAWVGLERGPLPPAEGEQLEKLILDDLDGYDSFRLVDASGHALDARLLAAEAALVARLKDQGVNAALEFKTRRALKKFNQAVAVFETRLVQLQDYELLHDTLLAKAEAQFQAGKRGAAKTTLERLATLSPTRYPTPRTHPPGLVKLWTEAKKELGPVGTINVTCDGCTIQIDGQPLGAGPLIATKIPPGKHYLVAKWPHGHDYETVRVAPGRETKAQIAREGPSEKARRGILETIQRRAGAEAAEQHAKRLARLAQAEGALLGAVKRDAEGKRWLILASHDREGKLIAIVKAAVGAAAAKETAKTVARMGALLFVDEKQGEYELEERGSAKPAQGVEALLYDTAGMHEQRVAKKEDETKATGTPRNGDLAPPPPPPPPGDGGLLGAWWFWTIIGVAVVGAGVGIGVGVTASKDPTTTEFEVILP